MTGPDRQAVVQPVAGSRAFREYRREVVDTEVKQHRQVQALPVRSNIQVMTTLNAMQKTENTTGRVRFAFTE